MQKLNSVKHIYSEYETTQIAKNWDDFIPVTDLRNEVVESFEDADLNAQVAITIANKNNCLVCNN